jgi:hypothetical protein
MRTVVPGCVVLLLSAAVAPGAAEEPTTAVPAGAGDPLVTWARIWGDTKGKGVYTCEEWKQYAARLFNRADGNHDGFLDIKEFESVRKADPMLRDAEFAYFDEHRRGRVSRSEFIDKPNPLFTSYDPKGTCKVKLEDISRASARSH